MTRRSLTLYLVLALYSIRAAGQSSKQFLVTPDSAKAATRVADRAAQPSPPAEQPGNPEINLPRTATPQFRVERLPIASGGELLTIFGRLDGMKADAGAAPE